MWKKTCTWITYPIRRLRLIVSSFEMSFPSMRIVPELDDISLFIILSVVVLPQPLGPISTIKVPLSIVKLIFFNITLDPIVLDTFLNSIKVSTPIFTK